MRPIVAVSCLLCAPLLVACSGEEDGRLGVSHASIQRVDLPCDDTWLDVYGPVAGLPPFDDDQRGKVVACARDGTIDAATIAGLQSSDSVIAPDLRDVDVYRISYRTERLAQGAGPRDGRSQAVVLIPHDAKADDVAVVWAHGTDGMGPNCASAYYGPGDYGSKWPLAIASGGWITIATDYAGYGDPDAMQGYLNAEDEAHSVLDATRAIAQMFGRDDENPLKVVLTGHSQGGGAVLAAQALDRSYGHAGVIGAVVPFAPMWFPLRFLGGLVMEDRYPRGAISWLTMARTLWYFAARTELEGEPLSEVFSTNGGILERAAVDNQCASPTEQLINQMDYHASDFFLPSFATAVGQCAHDDECDDPLGARWRERMQDDRPHLDPSGAQVVMWQGAVDTHVSPEDVECTIDRLRSDLRPRPQELTASLGICVDPTAAHSSVVDHQLGWLDAYIAARMGVGPEPAACAPVSTLSPGEAPYICPFHDRD